MSFVVNIKVSTNIELLSSTVLDGFHYNTDNFCLNIQIVDLSEFADYRIIGRTTNIGKVVRFGNMSIIDNTEEDFKKELEYLATKIEIN